MDFAKNFYYMLAPMEDITNDSFRILCHKHGADLVFTELVSFEALAKKNKCTLQRLQNREGIPTAIQLFGSNEYFLKKFLSHFEPFKGFVGFNLNLGCPAPNFVNAGVGCVLTRRVTKVRKLLGIIRTRGFRASVKLRLGSNQYEKDQKVYLNLLRGVEADFFVVHARHGKETYQQKSDWSVFQECCKTGKNIIANGDVRTKSDVELLKSYGVKGVMIGRAAVFNPGIFDEVKGKPAIPIVKLKREYEELSKTDEVFRYRKNVLKWMGKNISS